MIRRCILAVALTMACASVKESFGEERVAPGSEDRKIGHLVVSVSKDAWDKAGVIGQILTPMVVIVTGAILGYVLSKAREEESNRISAVQVLGTLMPYVTSQDGRTRETALLLISNLGHDRWSSHLAQTMRTILGTPALSRGGMDKNPVLGWVELHLASVLTDGSRLTTGIAFEKWLLYPGSDISRVVATVGAGSPFVINPATVMILNDYNLCACTTDGVRPSLSTNEASPDRVVLIGLRQTEEGIAIKYVHANKVPEESESNGICYEADEPFCTSPLAWMVVSLKGTYCVGLVYEYLNDQRIRVVPLEILLDQLPYPT